MKAIAVFICSTVLVLFGTMPVQAADVQLHFFWSEGCPHCAKEKVFLDALDKKYDEVTVQDYEVGHHSENIALLQKIGDTLRADISGVPFLVVGKSYVVGFLSDETTGKEIEQKVVYAIQNDIPDILTTIDSDKENKDEVIGEMTIPETLELPLIGQISVQHTSLPLLTFLLAFIDGFNPCAMWTLIFLISLLLGMKDQKRMWMLGITFIVTSAAVYFLFLSAWLNLFLVLGVVMWVRFIIGGVALFAGWYFLRDYYVNRNGGCSVMGDTKRQKFIEKMRMITQKSSLFLSVIGIMFLAVAVNMIELVCSAGLPAVYTKILSMSSLQPWQYYMYLFMYMLIFMADDLVIFITAMVTMKAVGIQSKYSRISHLVGGIVMIVIGILLICKPELLMFG